MCLCYWKCAPNFFRSASPFWIRWIRCMGGAWRCIGEIDGEGDRDGEGEGDGDGWWKWGETEISGDIEINNTPAPLGDTDRIWCACKFQIKFQGFFLVQCAITNGRGGISAQFVLARWKGLSVYLGKTEICWRKDASKIKIQTKLNRQCPMYP